jgi:DNA/RNA-binding domain of Phe-tRNA-synthetase-like protein
MRSKRTVDLHVSWNSKVSSKHPDLAVCVGLVEDTFVERSNAEIIELRNEVETAVVGEYNIETLKDNPTIRAYRDFYWKLGVDPTKIRPSGEALLRRILRSRGIPSISTVVDAYNLASLCTMIPISGFDRDLLNDPLHIRFAEANEKFIGIGMNTPQSLDEGTLVLEDRERILCIYPYRDSNHTKISLTTRNVGLSPMEPRKSRL